MARLRGTPWTTNAELPGRFLRKELPLPRGMEMLDSAVSNGLLSARGVDKVLRIAWTVADLQGRDQPTKDDLSVALALRQGEETSQ